MYNKYSMYTKDWHAFKSHYEKKTKDRCFLNSKCWKRLEKLHFEQYCEKIDKPFSFLFEFKYLHKKHFAKIPGSSSVYDKYRKTRMDLYNKRKS